MAIELELFGDESASNSAVVYSIVTCPVNLRQMAEKVLDETKQAFGGVPDAVIHCRLLFPGDQRRKTLWHHLGPDDVFALCAHIARGLYSVGLRFRVGHVNTQGLPDTMVFAGRHPATPAETKQLTRFAYTAAIAGFEKQPGFEQIRLWVDPDRTKIEWGGRRLQVKSVRVTAGDIEGVNELVPEPITEAKPSLLQVADILAYASANALSIETRPDKDKFRAICSIFSPEVLEFTFHEQTFRVPPMPEVGRV